MDFYLTTLGLGAVGLLAMAFSGFFQHGGHDAHAGHGSHGGHGAGHGHSHGHATHDVHAHDASENHVSAHQDDAGQHGAHAGEDAHSFSASQFVLALMSPRVLFTVCLGLGAAGVLLRPVLGGPLLFAAALAGGLLLDRLIVTPLWNLMFKFQSDPALTLESAVGGEATAVTAFNANGQGLISIEVDGQLIQLLGTLQTTDRELRARVGAGARLRVEDVDAARNRCTVSLQ